MSEHKNLSRRRFLQTALLAAGAGTLAACAPAPAAAPAAAPAKPAADAAKPTDAPAAAEVKPTEAPVAASGEMQGELVFWGHDDHPIDLAGQAFSKKNTGVKWTFVPLDDWTTKVEAALAANTGTPDLIWFEASDVQKNGLRGVLLDVDDLVKQYEKDLVPAKLTEARVKGKYFGFPGDITPVTYWYRSDLLEKAGVKEIAKDTKYEDLIAMSKTVKEKADTSLFVFGSDGQGQTILNFWDPFYALGGNVHNDTGEEILFDEGDAAAKAFEYAKMAWDTKTGLDAGWFSAPYWGAIGEGKLAATYSPPWMRGFFQSQLKGPEQGVGKWKETLLPIYAGGEQHRTNVFGGATLSSFNLTKVPDLVKKFMEFTFATIEGATVTGNWGIVPPYLPWLNKSLKDTKQTLFTDASWADTVNEALGQMRTDFYRGPAYGIAGGEIWNKYFIPIMKGEMQIKDAVKNMADEIRSENKKLLDSLK